MARVSLARVARWDIFLWLNAEQVEVLARAESQRSDHRIVHCVLRSSYRYKKTRTPFHGFSLTIPSRSLTEDRYLSSLRKTTAERQDKKRWFSSLCPCAIYACTNTKQRCVIGSKHFTNNVDAWLALKKKGAPVTSVARGIIALKPGLLHR